MDTSLYSQTKVPASLFATAGESCFGELRGLGMSCITFKGTPQDSYDILIIEDTFREVTKDKLLPPQARELWIAQGMELLGPPLAVAKGQLPITGI